MKKTDIIEDFLNDRLLKSESTRRNYRMNIETYFNILNEPIETYFENNKKPDDYENDLKKVYTLEQKKGRPALSMRTFFNSVKQLMINRDKRLKDLEFWDILKARTRGAEPDSDESIMNAADIKDILSHGNACTRALFLMLASSGRRISEILALTQEDINTDVSPTRVNIRKGLNSRQTKTGQKTICFISDEATECYKQWLKERDEYLKAKTKRNLKTNRDATDDRIFPMSYSNALLMWETLLMRSQRVEFTRYTNKWTGKQMKQIVRKNKGDRLLEHPHCLRKFYRSYLGDADLAEYLMGHSTMLTRAYRQMKIEDLAVKYQHVMPNVTIFETQADFTDINKSLSEKDRQIKELQSQLDRIMRSTLIQKLLEENGEK